MENPKTLFDIRTTLYGSGDSYYITNVFPNHSMIFEALEKEITYIDKNLLKFKIYGRELLLPRKKAFFGDIDTDGSYPLYRYGGSYEPEVKSWTPTLKVVRDHITKLFGQYCNHAVINRYDGGEDYIGYHRDKVRDFTPGTSVVTPSFGSRRRFLLKNDSTGQVQEVILEPGSVFILGPKTNEEWKHSIVKSKNLPGVRISVTLRSIQTRFKPQ